MRRLEKQFAIPRVGLYAGRLGVLLVCAGLSAVGVGRAQTTLDRDEVTISEADFKKLDTFEATTLSKADKVFLNKEYRSAAVEYNAFVVANPRSPAVAYALVRKGRSQMFDNKRSEAVRTFKEVVDYFPDEVLYAAAALYYQGVCHFETGNKKNAVIAWKKMVADPGYAKHVLAGPALVGIANDLYSEEKYADAVKYYDQVAVEFRSLHPESAWQAIDRASYIYIRLQTDNKKMSDFYTRAKTTRQKPEAPDETKYWQDMRVMIDRFGVFEKEEDAQRIAYYRYWSGVMEGRFLDDTEYRLVLAEFRYREEGDIDKWVARLDKQFAATYKPGLFDLVCRFMEEFGKKGQQAKIKEYYGKLNFAKMDNETIFRLMKVMVSSLKDVPMAKSAYSNIKQNLWNDKNRDDFIAWAKLVDEGMVINACQNMRAPDYGRFALLAFYHGLGKSGSSIATDPIEKGLKISEEVIKMPAYADKAQWLRAELFETNGEFAEAIECFKLSSNEPEKYFRIAELLLRLKQKEQALAELRGVEKFFESAASRAALRIAFVYQGAKEQANFIGALRDVMKKYPKSRESNTAHIHLERLKVGPGGTDDAH
ncbi:MAG: tetratricopeptide repeat protein [Lentisphaerae bacterium]|nr:tetratricopeptide repeat protein [Lentisphaerota bacterium]